MAFLQTSFFSEVLKVNTEIYVILPQKTTRQIGMTGYAREGEGAPVLYLLHGLSDDHTIWMRRTSIERYVSKLGLAVVMPAVGRSFYRNLPNGGAYWDYVSEELPAIVQQFFKVSSKREDTFVVGLSMGGYGAMKLALRCPDRFAAAASLSGVLDFPEWIERVKKGESALTPQELPGLFGPEMRYIPEEDDLFTLARLRVEEAKRGIAIPQLYTVCGREDFLYQDNLRFIEHARKIGLPLQVKEETGAHTWDFWDQEIQHVLSWLPLRREAP